MGNAATERSQGVLNRPVEAGKLARNTKKILNRRNEPKIMLTLQDLAFSEPQNELSFEFKKCQSKPKIWPKTDEQTPRDPALSFPSRLAVPLQRDRPAVGRRKSPARPAAAGSLRSAALRRKSRHSRESGNPVRSVAVDPRLRGGDEGLTLISMGGPQAHGHSNDRLGGLSETGNWELGTGNWKPGLPVPNF